MNRYTVLMTLIIAGSGIFSGCRETYTCFCAGGLGYQEYEKEVQAQNEKRAKQKCEADNPPPNSPDAIYCELK